MAGKGFIAVIAYTLAVGCATGCSLTGKDQTFPLDSLALSDTMPRELNKVVMPDYVIEPPDILTIDAVSTIPKPPYHLKVLDVLLIQVVGNGQPQIDGTFAIELDGTIRFGFPYDGPNQNEDPALRIDGPVTVDGLTIDEATAKIRVHLMKTFRDPVIRVSLAEIAGLQPIAGEHLVAPDGTVNLGTYGRVSVVGLTVEEATAAIEQHLAANYLKTPTVSVDVFAYNSKVYYVILQGAGLGDRVLRIPITGNETVLDAITQVEGLTGVSSTRMWISRPGMNSAGYHQILPIDWPAITQLGDAQTNYQILPGDRVYVAEDKLVALDTQLGKLFAPIQRVLGLALLASGTAQFIEFYEEGPVGGIGGGGL